MNSKIRISSLALALVLTGCGGLVRTPYSAPAIEAPARWQHASREGAALVDSPWWKAFGDARLDALIERVLANNNDLAAAGIVVKKAWLQAGLAADKQNPALSASLAASRSRELSHDKTTSSAYSATASVSYEVDLWGRLASARDAAEWEAKASEQDRADTAWALAATTAKLYWQIAWLNQRIELGEQNIAYGQKALAIARGKREAGAISGVDVLQAEQTLASQQASLSDLVQQRVEARNALSILFNAPPGQSFVVPDRLPEAELPSVEAGLPAALLGRRPDLQAAELRLRETLATGDATRASYYPGFSLTGSLGSSSAALSDLIKNPLGTLGASLSLPFLQWNEMKLSTRVAQADYEKAVISFRQSLYAAMSDVENALSARSQYSAQSAMLQSSFAAAQKIETIYETQYRLGAVPMKTWLDAQQTRREAEVALLANRYQRLVNHVTLIQALGGSASGGI
ncbi:efflux transporter outer membrane subunit [Niveibacterium terrae]|uniref:efflux transporter outer membrane subunit n=1 Tax=Niveibacterium terrae TaxID=3373598 RepID=UPI003A8F47C1